MIAPLFSNTCTQAKRSDSSATWSAQVSITPTTWSSSMLARVRL